MKFATAASHRRFLSKLTRWSRPTGAFVAAAIAAVGTVGICGPEALASTAAGPPMRATPTPSRRSSVLSSLLATTSAGLATPAPASALTNDERRVVSLFQHASPSVLAIAPALRGGSNKIERGTGTYRARASGFIWDDSHMVTSFHALTRTASERGVEVSLPRTLPSSTSSSSASNGFGSTSSDGNDDHVVVEVDVLGADPATDVAVLRVVGTGALQPLPRGTSKDLRVGQDVFAIGSPWGLEHSMSRGVVSGVARSLGASMGGLIQSDVSLSPGYGGSPLLDSAGAVVGLNTDSFTGGMPLAGVSLAVPIEALTRSVESVIKQGYVSRAWLGAEFAPDLSSAGVGPKGAMVLKVVPGGPADNAGLRPVHSGLLGDVIVGLQGQTVAVPGDVNRVLGNLAPGDAVSLSVLRPAADSENEDYERLELTVRLGAVQQRLQRA